MSKPALYIDTFSGRAAQLPRGRRTSEHVLSALRRDPRISAFDLSELRWLRNIISDLEGDGSISPVDEPYPWLRFVVNVRGGGNEA